MALGYFGSSGFYESSTQTSAANQQGLAQYANIANQYASTGNTVTYSGLIAGASLSGGSLYYPAPQALVNVEEKVVKIAKGILSKLRSEIDEWHGDVLGRCAA